MTQVDLMKKKCAKSHAMCVCFLNGGGRCFGEMEVQTSGEDVPDVAGKRIQETVDPDLDPDLHQGDAVTYRRKL